MLSRYPSVFVAGLLLLQVTHAGCVPLPVLAFGAGAATVAASSTEKGLATSISDSAIYVKISEAYFQTDLDIFGEVNVEVNQGSVLLTGNVDTPAHAIRAVQTAWQIEGVTEVIDEITVKDDSSIRDKARDVAAAAQLRAKLVADSQISSLNYSIDVVNGVVYLSGVARSQEEIDRAIAHAQSLRYATSVVNYVRLNTN